MDDSNKIHPAPKDPPEDNGSPEDNVERQRLRPVFGDDESGDARPRDFLTGFLEEKPDQADNADFQDSADDQPALKARVIEAIQSIFDPEIPVNIYELGLIYAVRINDEQDVLVTMTLTTPHCPVAESMPNDVQTRVEMVEGVRTSRVELVWDPPWDPSLMSEAAQLELGFL
jgi:FeS assembly SUF system protein